MSNHDDRPMYRTFEEFEREEIRRADAVGTSIDALFDGMFADDLDVDPSSVRLAHHPEADEEE